MLSTPVQFHFSGSKGTTSKMKYSTVIIEVIKQTGGARIMGVWLCEVISVTHFCIGKFIFLCSKIKAFLHLQGKGGGNVFLCSKCVDTGNVKSSGNKLSEA